MLETFREFFDLNTVIWLFPIIFIFHDLEEIITIEPFMIAHKNRKAPFVKLTLEMREKLGSTAAQLSISATWILLIISFTTLMTAQFSLNGGGFLLYTAILNLFILQAIIHIVQSIFFKGYTPGIITALCLLIPYSLIAYDRLFQSSLIDGQFIFVSLLISLVMIPVFLVGNLLGRYFIK